MKDNEKILLVVSPSRTHYIVPPIGLGYLAAALRSSDFSEVLILDCLKERLSIGGLEARLKEIGPKIVGFQIFSYDFDSVVKNIDILNKQSPETIIVIGGPHVSATGISALEEIGGADFAFMGEAEEGIVLLMRRILRNESIPFEEIPGLIWREQDKIRSNQRATINDLNGLSFPAWDLMEPASYPDNPQGGFYKKFPIAPIATTRGCPYLCTFCGSGVNMGRKLRLRSIDNVLDEMEMLYSSFGVREFHIIDDMFNFHKERVIEFCHGIKNKRWDISYTFPNGLRLNHLDKDMLKLMKDTGLYSFTVGVESGSQRILDIMKKNLTLKFIEEMVDLIVEGGLEPNGFFILGFPGETIMDINSTISFAKKLKLKRAHFSNFLPLPGTEATRALIESGEIDPPEWNSLFYSKVAYSPQGITKKQLKKLQRKAYFAFYLRPWILIKLVLEIKSFSHFRMIFSRMVDYLFRK